MGYEIIFAKERLTFFQYDEDNVYYFVSLPVNYETSGAESATPVKACLRIEMDRQRLSEVFALNEPAKRDGDQFSLAMFNLKHYLASSENIKHSFKLELNDLELIEPFRFELSLNASHQTVYLSFLIENCLRDRNVFFEIVDNDILIEEPIEVVNKKFVKKETILTEYIDSFIFNKNVGSPESDSREKRGEGQPVLQTDPQLEDRGQPRQDHPTGRSLRPLREQEVFVEPSAQREVD